MYQRICLFVLFLVIGTAPVYAGIFARDEEVEKALQAAVLSIERFELSRDELNAFYSTRDFQPVWNVTGGMNNRSFTTFLESIDKVITYHGLRREDYPLDLMQKLVVDPANKTQVELLITDSILYLIHDLRGDVIDLSNIYEGWNYTRSDIDVPAQLSVAVARNDLKNFIDSLTPTNPTYKQLAKALETYRAMAAKGEWPKISDGPTIKPDNRSPRVAQLRARLVAESYLPEDSVSGEDNAIYDEALLKAVLAYQMHNGLDTDGNIGPKVLSALNTPIKTRINQIRANMERWRHMPDHFPAESHVMINIPDASIDIVEDEKLIYQGPVIVGQVSRKTPFIQSAIKNMVINPPWHVPAKIARKDILPKLQDDPQYLEKLGIVIRDNEEDPYGTQIDWVSMTERDFKFHLRQSPGNQNSLGRIKFNFDNTYAVYMHGTPHEELFKKDERALSSGCVRLLAPEDVGALLLANNKDPWDVPRIQAGIEAGKTNWVTIETPMPLYVLYWSVFFDEDGQINFRKDIYGYDKMLSEIMGSTAHSSTRASIKAPQQPSTL